MALRITLVVTAALAAAPSAVNAERCLVGNGLELELALENASCTTLKTNAFEISGPRLDSIFADIKQKGLRGKELESLVFSGTKLTDSAVMSLGDAMEGGFLSASNLVFWNNGLDAAEGESSEAVFALIRIIQSAAAGLKELHFTDNVLRDEGAAGLGSALEGAWNIERVVLSGNGMGPEGVASVALSLAEHPALLSLSITGIEGGANSWMTNNVKEDGAKGISVLLKSSSSNMKTLVLSGTMLGDDGLKQLAKGFAANGNSKLEVLDLHRNRITDEGAKSLARVLKNAKSLQLLILTANRLTDEGVLALANAASDHPSLTVIDCDMNSKVSAQAKSALEEALAGSQPRDEL